MLLASHAAVVSLRGLEELEVAIRGEGSAALTEQLHVFCRHRGEATRDGKVLAEHGQRVDAADRRRDRQAHGVAQRFLRGDDAVACAYAVRVAVAGAHPLIEVRDKPTLDVAYIAGCLLVGMACGVAGRLFAETQNALQRLARSGSAALRIVGASLVLGVLAWAGHALSGSWVTLGPGHIATGWLLSGPHAAWLVAAILVIRTAGTLICVYGGGGGGVFTALACTGAFIGSLIALAFAGRESLVFPFIGAACFLSAGYRIPLCCMLWVGEASSDLVLTLGGSVAIAVAQVFVGDASVSEAKRETRG